MSVIHLMKMKIPNAYQKNIKKEGELAKNRKTK